MPTYYARGVSAYLGAMPLAETITRQIVLRKGQVAKQQCETAEKRLLESKLLAEEPVIFPGDEAGLALNWLGNAPFMQVQAGREPFPLIDKQDLLRRAEAASAQIAYGHQHARLSTDKTHDDDGPRALVLHIQLSDKTFVSGLGNVKLHLKIDVFFNGQLSGCLFLPSHDVRCSVKSSHHVFAGTRIDFLAERPWVLLPPGVAADGNRRRVDKPSSAQQRWEEICQVLRDEADKRGKDRHGHTPPSAEYLTALAKMQMPAQVRVMQKPNGRRFGVVDVVISAGYGRKVTSGTTYLKAPQRLADANYPLQVRKIDLLKQSNVARNERYHSEGGARAFMEPSPEVIDADAEADSDSDCQPQAKRQALMPHLLSTRSVPNSSSAQPSSNSFLGLQTPSMLPSIQDTWKGSLAPATTDENRVLSFSADQGRGHGESSSSPQSGLVHKGYGHADTRGRGRGASRTAPNTSLPDFDSGSKNRATSAHNPHMHAPRHNVQNSDPVLDHDSPSSAFSLMSFGGVGSISNPLRSFPMNFKGSHKHPLPPSYIQTGTDRTLLGSSPCSNSIAPSEHLRRSSFYSQVKPLSYATSSSQAQNGIGLQLPTQACSTSPHAPTSISPQSIETSGYCSFPPPYKRRPSVPLPPKGLYTVPTKPKRSQCWAKKPASTDRNNGWPCILVNRLIITGKNGSTLIDHRWLVAQRVAINMAVSTAGPSPHRRPVRKKEELAGSTEYAEHPIGDRPPRRAAIKKSSAKEYSVSNAVYRSGLRTLHPSPQRNTPSRVTELPTLGLMPTSPIATRLVPHWRIASSSSTFDDRGPKVTSSEPEDPKETLQSTAFYRRSESPTKRNSFPTIVPQSNTVTAIASSMIASDKGTSSPLSSAPSTPEPEAMVAVLNHVPTEAVALSPSMATASITQVDRSPDRAINSAPRHVAQPLSTSKLASTVALQLQAQVPSTPMSSPSPGTKKRKAPLPKLPRSPDRLKTVDNPPLNRDCVIAYAETRKKDSEQGVLRQIRGERQGVFREKYVVFATRFFIAGD
ncbi:Nn.00g073020.m01.CDS01 [Neocucurbitaria sp. VM-36]